MAMGSSHPDRLLYLRLRPTKDVSFDMDREELGHSVEKHLFPLTKIKRVFVGDELQVDDCSI